MLKHTTKRNPVTRGWGFHVSEETNLIINTSQHNRLHNVSISSQTKRSTRNRPRRCTLRKDCPLLLMGEQKLQDRAHLIWPRGDWILAPGTHSYSLTSTSSSSSSPVFIFFDAASLSRQSLPEGPERREIELNGGG